MKKNPDQSYEYEELDALLKHSRQVVEDAKRIGAELKKLEIRIKAQVILAEKARFRTKK